MNSFSKYRQYAWLLLLVPIYLFLFLKLGSAHLRLWDEGWFAVHAIEMLEQGSWFVSYFNGEPSYTSSKPPLQTWLQICSIWAFGISELSVRLPSAIAAAFTVLLLFFTVRKYQGSSVAWLSTMVLLTSIGFIGFHTARGAEADALLTLSLVGQAVCFFKFTTTKAYNWLLASMLLVGVAFWVKSVAGFLLLPGFALYTVIFERELLTLMLKSWQLYAGLLTILALIGGYLMLREYAQPGYLAMFFRSNVGRYTSSVGHDHPLSYYIRNMLDGRYVWWMPFAFMGFVLALTRLQNENGLVTFSAVLAVSFLVVITFSKSKLIWYDMPFYPFAAIPAGFSVEYLLRPQTGIRKMLLILILFAFPSYQMFAHTQANRLSLEEMRFEAQEIYLNQAVKRNKDLDGITVIHDRFEGALLFYVHLFESKGQHLELTNDYENLKTGDRILVNRDYMNDQLDHWELDSIDGYRQAVLFKINGLSVTEKNEL